MKSPLRIPWRIMGGLTSIALAIACYLEWTKRQVPSPLTAAPDSIRSIPQTIGFEIPAKTITRGDTQNTHSASAIELPNGDLRCYWFGGTREGHRDVSIWTSRWDSKTGNWDAPVICLERRWLEDETGLNIRKLGNPVVYSQGNRVELFVVGVSMGGWSGSAIYHLSSSDEGLTFQHPRRLVTSPFLNISTLVRNAALTGTNDKDLILPSYHEFTVKYPYWIQLDENRNVSYTYSEHQAKGFLQPSQVFTNEKAYTFLRDTHEVGAIHLLSTEKDNPRDSAFSSLPISNPNSGIAALALKEGILLACNDIADGRHRLSLLFQKYGAFHEPWQVIHRPETSERKQDELKVDKLRYSYPWLMQTQDGNLHLFYTWNRSEIRHLRFDAKGWPSSNMPAKP